MMHASRRMLWTVSIFFPALILSVVVWSSDLRTLLPALGIVSGSTWEIWTVAPRTMNFWVEATGILRATSVRDFGVPHAFSDYWQFQIVNIAPEGKNVKKGDLLVGFDAQKVRDDLERFQNELDQAGKELEKATAQIDLEHQELSSRLAAAENKYEKLKLKQEGLSAALEASSTIEFDRLALEQARREVEALRDRIAWHRKSSQARYNIIASRRARAEFKVKAIQRGMEQFEARADRDGVVVYKLKWNGERYQVGENVWSGMTIVEIPDLNTIEALAYVPEVDLGKVKIGQKVEITGDALPGKTYTGKVQRIGQLVRQKAWDIENKILEVEIALNEIDVAVMRPSMSIKARIETSTLDNILAVPLKGVRDSAGTAWVKLKTEAGWKDHTVKLGASNNAFVEIRNGLRAGDRIAADYTKVQ